MLKQRLARCKVLAPLLGARAIGDQFDTGASQRRLALTLVATAPSRRCEILLVIGGGHGFRSLEKAVEGYSNTGILKRLV